MKLTLRISIGCTTLLLLTACTSPALLDGTQGVARYQDYADHSDEVSFEMVLVQASHADRDHFRLLAEEGASIKIVPDADYFHLVRGLVEDFGFLEQVEMPIQPGTGGKDRIVLENEYGKWTLQGNQYDDRCLRSVTVHSFMEMVQAFMHTFNNVFALRVVDEEEGGVELFTRQQEKLKKHQQKWSSRD